MECGLVEINIAVLQALCVAFIVCINDIAPKISSSFTIASSSHAGAVRVGRRGKRRKRQKRHSHCSASSAVADASCAPTRPTSVHSDSEMLRRLSSLGPRSEAWRMQWCMRTCVSVAACCFIFFFVPTRKVLLHYTDPSFTVFVAALVKDVTLGATMMNIWACVLGSLIATVTAQIIYCIFVQLFESPDVYPISLLLVLLFMTVFAMQYMELQLMGKRLGVSLLALNLISWPEFPDIPINIWRLYLSVVIGCACGVVGCLLPWPVRLAGVEVRERLKYCCNTLCDLLKEEVLAWVFEPLKAQTIEALWVSQAYPADSAVHPCRALTIPAPGMKLIDVKAPWQAPISPAQRRWRRVRTVFRACWAFKRASLYGIGWLAGRQVFGLKDRHARAEMLTFLHEQLDTLLRRNQEARFESPSRDKAIRVFTRYINLLRALLQALRQLEHQVNRMDDDHLSSITFIEFFKDPDFRSAIHRYITAITNAVQYLFVLICEECSALKDVAESIVIMTEARETLNKVYFVVRKRCVLNHGMRIKAETKASLPAPAASGPFKVDVSFTLNTVLFLLDTVCDNILHFHSPDEISEMQLQMCCAAGRLVVMDNTWENRIHSCQALFRDLFPSQVPAYFMRYSPVKKRYELCITPAIRHRAMNATVVALAMTLAAIYGILAARKQPALASFTIAYLAGFPVSGMNIITCINRAAGTVLACIYVIFVVLLYGTIPDWAYAWRALLLSFATVAFQIPATYVRSFPLPSYGGVVAAFTAALLLFSNDPTVDQSIHRILDTFVGVGIFMTIELFFFAQSSESVLLTDIGNLLRGVQRQFLDFHTIFKSLRKYSFVEEDIVISTQTTAVEFDQLGAMLNRQRDLMPFYKSEPRLFSAPSLPDRLLQQLLTHEYQAMAAMQIMRFVLDKVRLQSCRQLSAASDPRMSFPAPEPVGRLRSQDLLVYYSSIVQAPLTPVRSDSDIEMAHSVDGSTRGSLIANVMPEFEAYFLPLQAHFISIEELVSATVGYLGAALSMLRATGRGSVHSSEYSSYLSNEGECISIAFHSYH